MRKIAIISVWFATLAGLASCGGPDVTTNATPQPVTTVDQDQSTTPDDDSSGTDEVVRSYVDALAATDDPEAMRDGLRYAAEGSVAYVYLEHRANLADAALDGGSPFPAYRATASGDGFEICDPSDRASCGTFAGFQTADGKLTDLTVDGDRPGPLLTTGNGDKVTANGLNAEFLTAYDAIAGSGLWVTIRITSGPESVELDIYSATYRAPDGRQRQVTDAYGPYELGADSNAMVALVFAGVQPGGTVSLTAWDQDYNEDELRIRVG